MDPIYTVFQTERAQHLNLIEHESIGIQLKQNQADWRSIYNDLKSVKTTQVKRFLFDTTNKCRCDGCNVQSDS